MAKVDYRKLPAAEREDLEKGLMAAFGKLGLNDEGRQLLRILLTESEVVMLGKRIRIAQRLVHGEPIPSICKKVRVSINTVRDVDRFLQEIWHDYRIALHSTDFRNPYSFKALRKKYPTHFLLINLLLDDVPRKK